MDHYNNIKEYLLNNEIKKRIKDYSKNKSNLKTYYNVGKEIVEAQGGETRAKYGNKLIEEYSKRLTNELGKGYSTRSLKLMRKFYLFQKGQPLDAQLTWSHYTILLSLNDNDNDIVNYYIRQIKQRNLSKRELLKIIKNKEYERLPESTKEKIINNKELSILEEIKDPIIINNTIDIDTISEKVLKELMLDDIDSFLKELGTGFCYIGNEYKIKIGNNYNYIDILLYNVIYHCYVVVELKITKLKKEHIGQIQVYMNYIDEYVKGITDNKTIGLIIVKENNKYIIKYSSDKRIKSIEYEIG